MNLFDWLNEITYIKSDVGKFSEADWKNFQPFLIHRYISMNPDYIELVNYVQRLPQDKPKHIYITYRDFLPKKKQWLKYIGKKKSKENKQLNEEIANYYEVSTTEASDYIELLSKKQLTEILSKRGIDEKEIKKLLKK